MSIFSDYSILIPFKVSPLQGQLVAKLPEKKSDAQQGEQLQDTNDAYPIAKPGQTSVEQSDANPEVQPDPISEEELMGQPGDRKSVV